MDVTLIKDLAEKVKQNIQKVIIGNDQSIDLLLVGLITSGHVLLEDVPGTGKTLLAKTLAKSLNCTFKRVQFTPDLLPSDLSGVNFYNQKIGDFQFREGPIFTNILLADEINRATPRTQSSLLECMEEKQVTIDGETRELEQPFIVIATQNPVENRGTFPLPEAQLDRFLLKINVGYPSVEKEVAILQRFKEENPLTHIQSVADKEEIIEAQNTYSKVHVSDELLQYIVNIISKTRSHPGIELGISPRGSQALLRAIQAYAVIKGRNYVLPDDVKEMLVPVCAHRIHLKSAHQLKENYVSEVLRQILEGVDVPTEKGLTAGL